MSGMSSDSAPSSSSSPPPSSHLKRKRKEPSDDSDDSSDSSDTSDADEEEPIANTEEEPVFSHAERRRQHKKRKLEEKKGDATSPSKKHKDEKASSTSTTAKQPIKRQNSVWVGNLSFKTTQDNLKTFFDGVGEITRIHMPTKVASRPGVKPENRGFAYVDFATNEAKIAAIGKSEQPLIGRKLLIKDGDDFQGRPTPTTPEGTVLDPTGTHKSHSKTAQKILRTQKQPPAPTLFLGNLGFETTENAIRELFDAHRTPDKMKKDKKEGDSEDAKKQKKDNWIRKVRMGTFEDSGLCKGFAFVDFHTIDEATSALINPKNHHLNGRNLVVEYAGADAVRRGAPKVKTEDGNVPHSRGKPSAGHRPQREGQGRRDKPSFQTGDNKETMGVTTVEVEEIEERHGTIHESRQSGGVRHKGPKTRPKPGAALALAKRESAAIIPGQKSQKIVF